MQIVDLVVVARTFLFLTNSGTPEGDRGDSLLHIGKMEKEFVHIDKLSTFVYSDIMQDARVREVVTKSGLGCLVTIDTKRFAGRGKLSGGDAADFVKYLLLR